MLSNLTQLEVFLFALSLIVIVWACLLVVTCVTYWWKGSLFLYALFKCRKGNDYPDAKKEHNFTLLLPARNESAVIEGLLESIKELNYPSDKIDIIVGVESLDDPTCEIARKYSAHVYVKKNLDKKGKGYIVKEMIDYAEEELKLNTEVYLIMDADNIMDPNFVKEMNKAYDAGYHVGVGYRNNKNWESNWISACSGLTFTRFSTLENLGRTRFGSTVQLSGTGFYISKEKLTEMGGWNFYTLTEDLELTLRLACDGTKTAYVSKAVFYDEQPTTWKDSKNQRLRWVKGYAQANKIYAKKLFKGISFKKSNKSNRLGCYDFYFQAMPFGCFVGSTIALVLSLLGNAIAAFVENSVIEGIHSLLSILILLIVVYLGIVIDTMITIAIEGDRIKMPFKIYLQTIFMNPFFLCAYIPISIKAMRSQKVEWVPIKHEINKDYKDVTGNDKK